MRTNNFQFVEIADDLAQVVDGGTSCLDVKEAIERWKKQNPNGSCHRHWKVMMNPGSPLEVAPVDPKQHSNGGYTNAIATGDETAVGISAYQDALGNMNRAAASYSAS